VDPAVLPQRLSAREALAAHGAGVWGGVTGRVLFEPVVVQQFPLFEYFATRFASEHFFAMDPHVPEERGKKVQNACYEREGEKKNVQDTCYEGKEKKQHRTHNPDDLSPYFRTQMFAKFINFEILVPVNFFDHNIP